MANRRGGRRAGNKGTAYPNRSDLRGGQLPVNVPTGLPYGENQQLAAAQRTVPMGTPGPPTTGGAPVGGGAPVPQGPEPGSLPFSGPTQRPNEPVTAGLPIGPGPGPEVLSGTQGGGLDPLMQAVTALDSLGARADAETARLRDSIHATIDNRAAP